MRRRLLTAALAALLALLAVLVPLTLPTPAPAGAAPVGFELEMSEGSLSLRDSEEPADLESPTTFEGTVDDSNGLITEGDFSAAPLDITFDIEEPVEATVAVDAVFTQLTPGAVASGSSVDKLTETEADVAVGVDVKVDLHIEVMPRGGGTPFATADCTSSPISLRLSSTAPYDYDTDTVTLEDADFTVPPVQSNLACASIIADAVNEMLAGGGHSITMTMEGEIPVIKVGICDTTTALTVDPVSSREGDEVTLSAEVTKLDPDNVCDPLPADPITGAVDFFDGTNLLGTVTLDANGKAEFATTSLPVGQHSLTAKYKSDETWKKSESSAVAHLVAAAPTVTLPDPIDAIVIQGNPRPVTVGLANPSEAGETITGARLDLVLARVSSVTSILTPDRISLEYFDGTTWTPVTLTEAPPRVLTGSVSGIDLEPGESLDARFRYRAFAVGTTPSLTVCQPANPTCPGPLTLTAKLVSGDNSRTFATDEGPVNLVEVTRRPSTTTAFSGGVVRPHTVRQGYSLLGATTLGPTFGAVPWAGKAEAFIDGVQVPLRDVSTPFEDGYSFDFEVRSGTITPWILLPADIEPGTHQLTMRYLGDAFHAPAETTGVFTVLETLPEAHPFICREATLNSQIEWGANIVFDADLPDSALPDTATPFTVSDARLLMHRQTLNGLMTFSLNNTTTAVGTNGLQAITFNLGEGQGSASGTAVARTGGTVLPNTPYPAPESAVDQTYDVDGVAGSFTVSGEPGETAAVELSELVFSYNDPLFNFPLEVRCTARGGLMEVGEVEIAGTTLTATPNPAREITDEVDLVASTFPGDAAGSVSFSSDKDGALGNVAVDNGTATLTTDQLSDGEHQITATFNATDPEVPDSQVTELVTIQYSPRNGRQAFVVAARTDFTGAADQADVLDDEELLAGGQSKATYLRNLSRSDAYLTHVVNQMYLDTLGREGDAGGVAFWVGKLKSGTPEHVVAASFYGSTEYYNRVGGTDEAWVEDLYMTLLGREGEPDGVAYWVSQIPIRTRGGVAKAFYQTPESLAFRVAALYEFFLDRAPSPADVAYWDGIVKSKGDIALSVFLAASQEYQDRAEDRFPIIED